MSWSYKQDYINNTQINIGREYMAYVLSPLAFSLAKGLKMATLGTFAFYLLLMLPSKDSYAVQWLLPFTSESGSAFVVVWLFIGLYILMIPYQFRLAMSYTLSTSGDKFIIKKGLLFTSIVIIDIKNVMHAEKHQSPYHRLFDVFDVRLFTHGDSKKPIDLHYLSRTCLDSSQIALFLGDDIEAS